MFLRYLNPLSIVLSLMAIVTSFSVLWVEQEDYVDHAFRHLTQAVLLQSGAILLNHLPVILTSALLSYVVAESARDIWHYLGHRIDFFWNHFHRYHHALYNPGWKAKSNAKLVQKERFWHQGSESLIMLITSASLTGILAWINPWLCIGSLYGLHRSLSYFLKVACEVIADLPHIPDANHTPHQYLEPPALSIFVHQKYHEAHHFGYSDSAYSGVLKVIDPILGTARSLKKSVGLMGLNKAFTAGLMQGFAQVGGGAFSLNSLADDVNLKQFDILAIDNRWSSSFVEKS